VNLPRRCAIKAWPCCREFFPYAKRFRLHHRSIAPCRTGQRFATVLPVLRPDEMHELRELGHRACTFLALWLPPKTGAVADACLTQRAAKRAFRRTSVRRCCTRAARATLVASRAHADVMRGAGRTLPPRCIVARPARASRAAPGARRAFGAAAAPARTLSRVP